MGPLTIVLASAALAGPSPHVHDIGRPGHTRAPVALVVGSAGIATAAYSRLVDELEAAGFDARMLDAPPGGLTAHQGAAWLRAAEPPALLVGHGLGGWAVLDAVEAGMRPDAVALLGVPLAVPATPLHAWLATLEVPPGGVDPAVLREQTWQGHAVVPLLLGAEPLPTTRLGSPVLDEAQERVRARWTATLPGAGLPLWIGSGAVDELAPVEGRPTLPGRAVVHRFGQLHGWSRDATATDLLRDPRPARQLAQWAQDHVGQQRPTRGGAP